MCALINAHAHRCTWAGDFYLPAMKLRSANNCENNNKTKVMIFVSSRSERSRRNEKMNGQNRHKRANEKAKW